MQSAVLIANLRQEVTESKDSLNQQFKKMVQREAEKAVEVKDLKDLIQSLTEKNAEVQCER